MNPSRTRQYRNLQLWFAGSLLFLFALNHLAGLAVLFLYSFQLAILSEKIISMVLLNSMAETAAAFFLVNRYLFQCTTNHVGLDSQSIVDTKPEKRANLTRKLKPRRRQDPSLATGPP
jgi:hypothetical protein